MTFLRPLLFVVLFIVIIHIMAWFLDGHGGFTICTCDNCGHKERDRSKCFCAYVNHNLTFTDWIPIKETTKEVM